MRNDGRTDSALRPIKVTRGFTQTAAGSVLWQQGGTLIFATASIVPDVPPWMKDDKPGGWITAEYVMLPASTPMRKPWPKSGVTDSRGTEIQRMIGRSLRAAIDLSKIGPNTINLDCQVMQADGGTRTASICAAWVALYDALQKLPAQLTPPKGFRGDPNSPRWNPANYAPRQALVEQISAISVGLVGEALRVDLDYADDSQALVDFNVAMTAGGKFVEVQGSAENGGLYSREQLSAMLDAAAVGCAELAAVQRRALGI